MVLNSTVTYFILGAYLQVGNLRYLYFMLTAFLYVVMVVLNISLIVVICMNRSLHEPMYMFLCSLFVNELYGSSGLFPLLLVQILSDIHTVSASFCYLQVYCLYTYGNIEFVNLVVMSYDRYLSICCPLQYHTRMTCKKAVMLVGVIWSYSCGIFLIKLSLTIRLPLCGNVINSLYCLNYPVVKLACSDTKVNSIYGTVTSSLFFIFTLVPILFSYLKILHICFFGSKQTRQKAVSTCTPHLVSLMNFAFGGCFQIFQSRFDMTHVPGVLQIILALYFVIIQPFLNPIMYGLQMSKIRKIYIHLFRHKRLTGHRDSLCYKLSICYS